MNIQIGICQWSIPAQDAEQCLTLAARLGLSGVGPDLGSYEQDFPLSHREEQTKYTLWRERLGLVYPALAVNALCQYGMSDAAARPIVETAIAKAVETAAALDIPIIQLPSFVRGDIVSGKDFEHTVDCLRFACRCAKGTDLIIGSENALPAEKQIAMIEAVGSEQFKIYFDTRNLFGMKGYDSVHILETLIPHICQVHIKDGIDNGPSVLLGEGNSGFEDSMHVLQENDYGGWLLLENDYARMAEASGVSAEQLLKKDIQTAQSWK